MRSASFADATSGGRVGDLPHFKRISRPSTRPLAPRLPRAPPTKTKRAPDANPDARPTKVELQNQLEVVFNLFNSLTILENEREIALCRVP